MSGPYSTFDPPFRIQSDPRYELNGRTRLVDAAGRPVTVWANGEDADRILAAIVAYDPKGTHDEPSRDEVLDSVEAHCLEMPPHVRAVIHRLVLAEYGER